MKRIVVFLITLFLITCYRDDYTGNSDYSPLYIGNPAYIYDSRLLEITDDSCDVIGVLDDIYLNRKCNLISGYIQLGPRNVFRKSGYNIDLRVYLMDTLYVNIKEYKLVFYDTKR